MRIPSQLGGVRPLQQHGDSESLDPGHRHPGIGGDLLGGDAVPDPVLDLARAKRSGHRCAIRPADGHELAPGCGAEAVIERDGEFLTGVRDLAFDQR